MAYLLILIINLVVFWVIYSLFKKNQELNKLEILKLQERYQKQYIDNANIQYNSIRKIKHDLKNQLSTIYTLMSTNKVDAAMEFINKNAQVISNTETFVMTENHVVNAILNSKFATATTFGINVSCLTVSDFSGIDDIDICNLLSNALDNSLTACMNIADDNERSISVEISKENDIYTFLIRNSINNPVMESNPDLLTTKKEKDNHGFGIQIIKDIAQKYNGRCDFYEDETNFYCQVLLKSTNKSST